MCTTKHDLVKDKFTSVLNMDLSIQALIEKTIYGVEKLTLR